MLLILIRMLVILIQSLKILTFLHTNSTVCHSSKPNITVELIIWRLQFIKNLYIQKNQITAMTSSKRKDQSIKTYLRIKPLLGTQDPYYTITNPNTIILKGQQEYTYGMKYIDNFIDRIFDVQSTNQDMFQQIGQPLIKHCMEGYNACVLAYGQTSSGKTYTMKGAEGNEGLIPLTLRQMFKTIQNQNLLAEIRISYLEIYNQNIIDLLNSVQSCLEIRQDPRKNITIIGLNEIRVSKVEEAMKLFQQGQSRRKFASNSLNISSSRSHAIFRMNVEIVHEDFSKTNSCINMVDLAGSEGVSRTKAQGNMKKQGQNINKSILALSNVIRCMSEKQSYVNFRDSKLTRILQSSLCNNSRSVVICNIYPTFLNYQETINTLKFGLYASQVKLQLRRNITNAGQTNHKYQASEAKDGMSQDEVFEPKQRIQYVENKRIIAQLRQENQELRDYKRILNEKIEFLQLENHRMTKNFDNLEQKLKTKKFQETNFAEINNQQRQQYQKRIKQMKGEMQVMADKYEAINQYSSKLQKNQRYLIERITKYQSQIAMLKQTISTNEIENMSRNQSKAKTPLKPKHQYKFNRNSSQEVCPLTIGSIIVLKAQILELKQVIYGLNQEIAGLVDERNQLLAQIQEFKQKELKQQNESQQVFYTDPQKKQIKNLHIRIKQLKNQNHSGRIRQKKLTKMLKECSQTWIEQMDEFNQWYAEKKKRLDSIKKQRSGSAKRPLEEN